MVDAGQSRPALLAAVAAVIAAGLSVRVVPLGLPAGVVKYAGSTLWGAFAHGLLACLEPPVPRLPLIALAVSAAVEVFRLVHTPWFDALRLTLAR